MGFSYAFGNKRKMRKLIGNYVRDRVRERRVLDEQIKRLIAQFHGKQIEEQTFERLRVLLETQYYQKQQQEWGKIQNNFHNPLNS